MLSLLQTWTVLRKWQPRTNEDFWAGFNLFCKLPCWLIDPRKCCSWKQLVFRDETLNNLAFHLPISLLRLSSSFSCSAQPFCPNLLCRVCLGHAMALPTHRQGLWQQDPCFHLPWVCIYAITKLWSGKYKKLIDQKGAHCKFATTGEAHRGNSKGLSSHLPIRMNYPDFSYKDELL